MNIKDLKDIPPWQWPKNAGKIILGVLRNDQSDAFERLLAAELGGDYVVVNDDLADTLLSILCNPRESHTLRGQAAISLGLNPRKLGKMDNHDQEPWKMPMQYSDEDLKRLLKDTESDPVERKETWAGDTPEKGRQAVCAFANDLPDHRKPGILFLGAKDNGTPSGLPISDELLRTL